MRRDGARASAMRQRTVEVSRETFGTGCGLIACPPCARAGTHPMLSIAIGLLWLLIGIICLAGVVWLVLYGIKSFVTPIPARLEQGIWFIVLILIIIGVLTILAGGGLSTFHGPNFR